MKVIKEEILRELIRGHNIDHEHKEIAADLIDSLEEIDTLAVSKLRPMCDAPKDGCSFLVAFNGSTRLHEAYFDSLGNLWSGDQYYKSDLCIGWEHIPIYKPELAGDCE